MKTPIAAALSLLIAATATACVDREEGMEEAEVPQDRLMEDTLAGSAADTAGVFTVVLDEWTVRPARDTVEAGTVTFRARNNGSHPHILEVEGQGEEWMTDTIQPGQWADVEAELAAGEYELYCPIEGDQGSHEELGMETRLLVLDRR